MSLSKLSAVVVSIALALTMGGCAGKQPGSEFTAKYYPECYDPIAKLCQDQENS